MASFQVPTRSEVSENNQAIFDNLKGKLGFVPNLYAFYAHSDTALGDYLNFSGRQSSLSNKEKEVINLVTSQVNDCDYCQAAHTALGKMNGFTDEQILEIRGGKASFDAKLNALAKLTASIVSNRGRASEEAINNFLAAGYTNGNLVDAIVQVGDKTISNYLHNLSQIPVDFPAAPSLESTAV
ncbi:MAG: carboxymuconolactone decarboxylase family protein [Bacteroidota bacterium]